MSDPAVFNFHSFSDVDPQKAVKFLSATASLGESLDMNDVLMKIADITRYFLDCDRASIFVWDKRSGKLWTKVAHGIEDRIEVESNKGIVGWVFTNQRAVIINDPYSDPRFNPEIDRKTGYRTKSIICFPLRTYSGKVVGVLEGINKNGDGVFTEEDMKFGELISIYAANSIENAMLYDELIRTQNEIVYRLSIAAEYRDETTYFHIVRMSFYAYFIAKEMGLDEEWCQKLKLAAPMHDIGKLGVPDRILLKPAKLSDEEFSEMKKHTEYGYEILKGSDIDVLNIAANIALCHHERYDGNGYPRGLKGEEIPLEARIIAVADVFDALTSKRPYKEPFPLEVTLKMIKDESGKHFDPKVVQAFEKALPQIIKVMEKYRD